MLAIVSIQSLNLLFNSTLECTFTKFTGSSKYCVYIFNFYLLNTGIVETFKDGYDSVTKRMSGGQPQLWNFWWLFTFPQEAVFAKEVGTGRPESSWMRNELCHSVTLKQEIRFSVNCNCVKVSRKDSLQPLFCCLDASIYTHKYIFHLPQDLVFNFCYFPMSL